ncbi:DnaJ-domain-containing protein [Lepidopterella palustris CBS 459.81]|uniref:DnaJ-domain-containing protein n=1 Tax=Lepidopterella palustris CBS 459.81 TaxID=1314670 RepID=A0A8E2E649_9PEZI|nr:DnaJ-domain-containing protein [Lepidopterella palustris CBS 459.81]
MPPRLASLLRPQCPYRPQCLRLPPLLTRFHTSTARNADSIPNHYETLELQHTASLADIKRQFFTLSKLYHPDKNPSNPSSNAHFIKISEAYHILSSPSLRKAYDRDLHAHIYPRHRHGHNYPSDSHGSASAGHAGGRPASGLSRRRAQFRGPPPSFYKAGGYGTQGDKRAEHAHTRTNSDPSSSSQGADADSAHIGTDAGFSPGQATSGTHVPHFDHLGHKRTHESVARHFNKRARRDGAHFAEDLARTTSGGSMLFNFFAVGGAVIVIGVSATWFQRRAGDGRRRDRGLR